MNDHITIAGVGLGPIGLETLRLAARRPWAEIVGAVDIDPAKAGRDLGELTRTKTLRGRRVHGSPEAFLARTSPPDVVFHTAASRFDLAYPLLEFFARQRINVVSSCEELLFPSLSNPGLAARLHQLCRRNGSRIVATGVNPGFVMDVLPICLTGVTRSVRAIHVQRVVDASTRREPLQRKIGSGLPLTEFRRRFSAGQAGHAGLRESLALLAHSLGWKLTALIETRKPVVAQRHIQTQFLHVRKGQACGLHQRAEGKVQGKVRLTLDLKMFLDAPNPHDAIQIEGDPPLDLRLPGGVAGDHATVAALVNTVPRLLQASPGLRLMTDLALPSIA